MKTPVEQIPATRSRRALWLGLAFGGAVIGLFMETARDPAALLPKAP